MNTMTTTIEKRQVLEKDATKAAADRGHRMTPFAPLYEQRHIAESVCERCEAYVQVNAKPAPNQIGIGGTAVVLNCRLTSNRNEQGE